MGRVLLCDPDVLVLKSLTEILKLRDGHTVMMSTDKGAAEIPVGAIDKHVIYYASSPTACGEIFQNTALDMIFINLSFVDDKPAKWVSKLRGQLTAKIIENSKTAIVLIGTEMQTNQVRKYMDSGITDYLAVPLDPPLLIQKYDFFISGKVNLSDRQLYSFQTTQAIDVGFVNEIEEISEFGCTIKTNLPVKLNDVLILRCQAFSEDGREDILARVWAVGVHPNVRTINQVQLAFFGINNSQLKNIRKWLRAEYARKKSVA
jgi:response regulator of citrate/malate metabolism